MMMVWEVTLKLNLDLVEIDKAGDYPWCYTSLFALKYYHSRIN